MKSSSSFLAFLIISALTFAGLNSSAQEMPGSASVNLPIATDSVIADSLAAAPLGASVGDTLAVAADSLASAAAADDITPTFAPDTVAVIIDETLVPDELYGDTVVVVSPELESTKFKRAYDSTHQFHWEQFVIPTATATVAALFVKTPKLVQAREWVQKQLANKTGQTRTKVDDYIQYAPMLASYAVYFAGVKGEHNLLDRTIILAMSYATFAVVNNTMKFAFSEQRPNSGAHNSFPSGHTGTAFVGAEFLRREYWSTNKWIGVAGYACAAAVAYLRIYNNRHWINDVVCGAAIGYMSTAFAYWLYPKIFRKRARMHYEEVLQRENRSEVACFATPYASSREIGVSCLVRF